MYTYNRFEIWLAKLPKQDNSHITAGTRPVILISNDAANLHSSVLTVIPVTSKVQKRQMPTHVYLAGCGLSLPSLALAEQVTAIDKTRLIKKIGYVSDRFTRMQLIHALEVQLGIVPLLRPAA